MKTLTDTQIAELRAARAAGRVLAALTPHPSDVTTVAVVVNGDTFELPTVAVELLRDVLSDLSIGVEPVVAPGDIRLGTSEIGRMLGVSAAWVGKLIDSGELPGERSGTKRRVALRHVVRHNRRRSAQLASTASRMVDSGDPLSSEPLAISTRRPGERSLPSAMFKPVRPRNAAEPGLQTMDPRWLVRAA